MHITNAECIEGILMSTHESVDIPETVGTTEAAEMLGISYPTLNRWIKMGYLPVIRLPSKRRRIPVDAVSKLLQQTEPQPLNDLEAE